MSADAVIRDLKCFRSVFDASFVRFTCRSSAVVIVKFVTASINRDSRETTGESSFRSQALKSRTTEFSLVFVDEFSFLPFTNSIIRRLERVRRGIANDRALQLEEETRRLTFSSPPPPSRPWAMPMISAVRCRDRSSHRDKDKSTVDQIIVLL